MATALQIDNALSWWLTEDIRIALLNNYVYSASHSAYSDISGFLVSGGLSNALANKGVASGVVSADPYTYSGPTFSPLTVEQMWLIRGTGAPTDKLVAFWDSANGTLPLLTIGGVDVLVQWDPSGIFQVV